jgi:hypothetical protein
MLSGFAIGIGSPAIGQHIGTAQVTAKKYWPIAWESGEGKSK